jgi:hypothetical protein
MATSFAASYHPATQPLQLVMISCCPFAALVSLIQSARQLRIVLSLIPQVHGGFDLVVEDLVAL